MLTRRDGHSAIVKDFHGTSDYTFVNAKVRLSLRASGEFLEAANCEITGVDSAFAGRVRMSNCTLSNSISFNGNAAVHIDNCLFDFSLDHALSIQPYFGPAADSGKKIMININNCTFEKHFTSHPSEALKVMVKGDTAQKWSMILADNVFYNKDRAAAPGKFPIYLPNGISGVLGMSYLDDTVQHTSKSYEILQNGDAFISKITMS